MFIYDIPKGDQTVSKNNHYNIFKKEIIHNFIKDSYLEIILKVLTEISNYVLIGLPSCINLSNINRFFSNIM